MIKHAYSKKHVLLALNSEMLISLVVLVNFDGDSWEWLGTLADGDSRLCGWRRRVCPLDDGWFIQGS